jgi:hypothetical protein
VKRGDARLVGASSPRPRVDALSRPNPPVGRIGPATSPRWPGWWCVIPTLREVCRSTADTAGEGESTRLAQLGPSERHVRRGATAPTGTNADLARGGSRADVAMDQRRTVEWLMSSEAAPTSTRSWPRWSTGRHGTVRRPAGADPDLFFRERCPDSALPIPPTQRERAGQSYRDRKDTVREYEGLAARIAHPIRHGNGANRFHDTENGS